MPEPVADVPPSPPPGARLGRYELLTRIARGGMAEVWLARQRGDLGFSRLCAVKTIRPEVARDPLFRKMFLDEARIASRIRHANVAEVLDLGEEGPIVYLAMPYVEGGSLRDIDLAFRREHPGEAFPLGIALRVVADVATGLHAAHELTEDDGTPLEVVHRDVSPQNVLVGSDGVAKLCDFGIAKALGRVTEETEAGQLKGKFAYLSPEQVERRPLDRRSDVFAAGIVLWELCTGRRLFQGDDVVQTVAATIRCHVPDPREHTPDLPQGVVAIVLRALAKDRDRRFATGEDLARALEDAARGAGSFASSRDVATFVGDLMKGEARARREGARRAAEQLSQSGAEVAAAPAIAAAVADVPSARDVTVTGHALGASSGATRRAGAIGVVLAVTAAVGATYAFTRGDGSTPLPPATSLAASPSPTASPAPTANEDVETRASAASSAPPDAPPASASAASASGASASAPSPSAARPATRPRLPRFGSPYGK